MIKVEEVGRRKTEVEERSDEIPQSGNRRIYHCWRGGLFYLSQTHPLPFP